MEITGVAHPAPRGGRDDPSDLSPAEIGVTRLGGRPLFYEHNTAHQVGNVLTSWESRDGNLRMAANVTDPAVQQKIRNGSARGLSLGTDMISTESGEVLYREQSELSVCAEGKRAGTWIESINGKRVHHRARASRGERAAH